MDPRLEHRFLTNRRQLLWRGTLGVGAMALGSLLGRRAMAAAPATGPDLRSHFRPTAKRIIYLFQSGAPSQMDLFDYKPRLAEMAGVDLPDSVRQGQRLTGMTANQKSFPLTPTRYDFKRHGQSGAWVSEMLPHTAGVVDHLCFIKSMHTEAINHDPAITFMQTGHQQPGRPSLGAWMSYGLGSENADLPSFVVMLSRNTNPIAQPTYDRLWGAGFLPSNHQGVKLRSSGDPVLFLSDPCGEDRVARRRLLNRLASLNQLYHDEVGDPEVPARTAQYELAYRMQMSIPEVTDLSNEPESILKEYGEDARKPGTYAANCLLARRLAERGVRFIQLYHQGWDHHGNLPKGIARQCRDPCAGPGST